MTVLKARVAGAWQTIGSGFGPAGGAASDFLIKNSATDFDAVWGTTAPKLVLNSATILDLSSTAHPLTLGVTSSYNIAISSDRIQARNNGANSLLRLNHYGGQVVVGSGDTTQFPPGLQVADSAHATSRRSNISLGSGWQILQDYAGSGVKDFIIYQQANGRVPFQITSDGLTVTFSGPVRWGNGQANIDYTTEFRFACGVPATFTCTRFNVLNAAGNAWFFNHDGTTFWTPSNFKADGTAIIGGSLTAAGVICLGNMNGAGEVYTGTSCWFRVRGASGIFWEDYGVGWQGISGGIQNYLSTQRLDMQYGMVTFNAGYGIRLYNNTDTNHELKYSSEAAAAIDPGSGVGSNGPKLTGYTTVWLRTMADGKSFLFYQSNSYLTAAGVYSKFSSRKLKEEITPLDPDECLNDVANLEPVSYYVIGDRDKGRRDGFIAEDVFEVTPQLCVMTPPDSEDPNHPHALDYSGFTVRLTGAVQALLNRIEELEKKVA